MEYLEWYKAIEVVKPHVVRIMTPEGSGTGFLVSHSQNGPVCAIATAAQPARRLMLTLAR
jgi:hypothetical protein